MEPDLSLAARRAMSAVRGQLIARRDPVRFARGLGVRVGEECLLITPTAATFGGEPYLVWIGDRVVISADVRMVTHDGAVWVGRHKDPDLDVAGPVIVRSGAFVGLGATLLLGSVVGEGAVIAAGAVLTGKVPAGMVAAGVPARPICSVAEYLARARKKNLHTYGLSAAEKRQVFVERFAERLAAEEYRSESRQL